MRTERVGFAICGSFCTHGQVLESLKSLVRQYETVIPIVSEISASTDTRFGAAQDLARDLKQLLKTAVPMYIQEGKSQLTIAFGCTGGKHRSVSFAWRMAEELRREQENVFFTGRDFRKVKA